MIKQTLGRFARQAAPRTVVALEDVDRIRRQVEELTGRLHAAEERLAGAVRENEELRARADEVESELRGRLSRLEEDLVEQRRLSLRVGQLTDLVFSRLAGSPTERRSAVRAAGGPVGVPDARASAEDALASVR